MMQAPRLRPFQAEVLNRIDEAIAAGHRRILFVCPTGGGKTIIASDFIRGRVAQRLKAMFLAHRRELISQAAAKLLSLGVDSGTILAGVRPRPGEAVQVGSVQTIHARAIRTRSIELHEADVLVIDEAHHAPARTYQKIIERFPNAIILGLTATPCRSDGRGLGSVFDVMIEAPSVSELISLGFLVPTRVYAPSRPDLKGVRIVAGDYNEKQLGEHMDKVQLVGDIVSHWLRLAEGKQTVVFATTVAHSVHIRDEFRRAGVLAEHIDGETPVEERERILAQLDRGEIEVLSNCMVCTEGWDCPSVSVIVLARPTKSIGLYRQMIGRVLRPAPGKEYALVIDHAGSTFEHGFAEDDITWTLREDTKAENRAHASRGASGTGAMPRLVECPECLAVMFEGRGCTICGWKPRPRPESFAVRDGNLGEVGRDRKAHVSTENRLEFYGELLWIARDRGFKPGWAYHKYREKFGTEPKWRSAAQIPPKPETLSWVRSRQIAYAKAQQKERAA